MDSITPSNLLADVQKLPLELRLVTPEVTAGLLGTTENTLAVWRCERRYDLPFVKVGSRVMYKLIDVKRFIDSRTRPGAKNLGKAARP
jgi:hypothetical protein